MESAGGGSKEAPNRPLTAEEEAIKRSTDCVYFLASPLTCKKGAECEYRHSEGARMNPRDCYFWLNGSCLNPKCSFRHPPIEGLFGNPGNNSVQAPSLPTIPKLQMPAVHQPASYNPNKQSTPCFYFQKGLCLKGDRCSFMHGPLPASTPIPHQQVPKVTESSAQLQQTLVKEPWVLKGCTSQQNTLKVSAEKPVEVPVIRAESRNYLGLVHERGPSPHPPQTDIPRSQIAVFPVSSGQDGDLPQHSDERSLNGRDADEFVGESSPGFDVLVDDEIEDPEYLGNEDEFGTEQGQVGRNLYPVTELNYRHSEYKAVGGFEGDLFDGAEDYGRNGGVVVVRDRYSHERHSMTQRRRAPQRGESPEEMDVSDLRHRLLKQRRLNGSRSDADPDHRGGPHRREDRRSDEERYHGRRPHREQQQQVHRESPISARLQGRVTLPARPLPDPLLDPRSDRERDRVSRLRGRLSPPRVINNYRDRTNRTSHESSRGGQPIRSQNAEPLDFASPKSLAELKGSKPSENSQERQLSERRPVSEAGYPGSNGSASFQGPKPLSDILKRKREATPEDYDNRRADAIVSVKKEDEPKVPSVEEEEEEEGLIASSADELDQVSPKDTAEEIEEGAVFDNVEDHEEEIQIQYEGNEEPEYAAIEGDDAKAEDPESLYPDGDEVMEDDNDVLDEEDEDDDEDDFARKVGVMFS